MSKIDTVRKEMMDAMKAKDAPRKAACSLLLSALKAAAIDKRADLTEEEENTVILREIKQLKETLETAGGREDIVKECQERLAVLTEFAPKAMSEEEIRAAVAGVIASLGLEAPTAKNKGQIMKNLMPLVKGKADSGLVNQIVSEVLE